MNYLNEGKQTQITPNIKNISSEISGERFDYITNALIWIDENLIYNPQHPDKMKMFRKRTAEIIISDGFTTGCTDIALVFIVLCRAKGIPAKYVEVIKENWLENGTKNNIQGHVFAEVEIGNRWFQIDPQMLRINLKTSYKHFKIFGKGLDSWDLGIESFEDMKEKFVEFKKISK